jgi:hypothetical protein
LHVTYCNTLPSSNCVHHPSVQSQNTPVPHIYRGYHGAILLPAFGGNRFCARSRPFDLALKVIPHWKGHSIQASFQAPTQESPGVYVRPSKRHVADSACGLRAPEGV